MTRFNLEEIGRILRDHQRFAVLGHVRPDGDALGSQLALALSLQQLGKEVRVWNEDGMLEKYSFLPRAELLTKPPSFPENVDVAIALDTAIQNRLGTALAAVRSAKIWINIDHHLSNPGYGNIAYVDPSAPATAEIVFRLIKSQGLPFNRDIAENLYAAISTDTGSFQYPKTSAHTLEIAAELIRAGLDVGRLNQQLYENYPRRRLELLRELLRTMRFEQGDSVARSSRRQRRADRPSPRDSRCYRRRLLRRIDRRQGARQHAFEKRCRRRLCHLPEVWRWRTYSRGGCARTRDAR